MEKIYYLPVADWDSFFGSGYPVCIDAKERDFLAAEWGLDIEEDFREATADEIEEYGVYDSDAE